jgi:hypothetical protein
LAPEDVGVAADIYEAPGFIEAPLTDRNAIDQNWRDFIVPIRFTHFELARFRTVSEEKGR